MKITVIVPTHKRTQDLKRCISALASQTRKADEVLLISREEDSETQSILPDLQATLSTLKPYYVEKASQVASLNVGLENATGDIICFTDDDSAPRVDWLLRIEQRFLSDTRIGGVGGRDYVVTAKNPDSTTDVIGRVFWYGRILGLHNNKSQNSCYVDHLKGVNMSYRKEAISGLCFDARLRGRAEYRNDFAISLAIKSRGWKLFYDPELIVDHHVAIRSDDTQRGAFNAQTTRDESFNEMLVILCYLPFPKKISAIIWFILCGNIAMPGPVQFFRKTMFPRSELWKRFIASSIGKSEAFFKAILG